MAAAALLPLALPATLAACESGKEESTHDGPTYSVACLGNSITRGFGLPGEKYSYPSLMEADEMISSVQNVGYSASTVGLRSDDEASLNQHAFVNRYTQIGAETDIIFVLGGTNGYRNDHGSVPLGEYGDTDSSAFYGAMEVLIAGLTETYPGAVLLFGTPLPRYDADMTEENESGGTLEDYRDAVLEACGAHGIETLDPLTAAEPVPEAEGHEDWYSDDGVHPNTDGAALIAEYVLAKIRDALS